jgi:hypothetical protein
MNCYVLLDAIGIQKYIFDTNTLRIIIGASQLLAKWQSRCKENWKRNVIVSAGGNILARFETYEDAVNFKQDAIGKAPPGIDVAWAIVKPKENQTDQQIMQELQKEVARFKCGDRESSAYDRTFFEQVEPGCRYCGIRSKDGNEKLDPHAEKDLPACKECRIRYAAGKKTDSKDTAIGRLWCHVAEKGFDPPFPSDLEELTRKEKSSEKSGEAACDLLAVAVVDLNDMGEILRLELEKNGFEGLKHFSETLQQNIDQIFCKIADKIKDDKRWFGHKTKAAGNFLRLHPLLLGGDDMVLAMPAPLWPEFIENLLGGLAEKGYPACAGVVVAKHTFPINRLVEMAEELTGSAKSLVRFNKLQHPGDMENPENQCAIDWHVHQESAFGSPLAIRKKHFVMKGERFPPNENIGEEIIQIATDKPYSLNQFFSLIESKNQISKISNSKLFGLYTAIRSGTQATRDFMTYVLLRDENERLDKYEPLWNEMLNINSQWPFWEDFSANGGDGQPCKSTTADVLELLFLTRPEDEGD